MWKPHIYIGKCATGKSRIPLVCHVSLVRQSKRAHFSQQDTYNLRKTSSRGRPTRRCTGPRKAPESPWLDSAPGAARDPTWKKWVPQGPQGLGAPGGGGATRATRARRGHAGAGQLLAGHFLAGFFFFFFFGAMKISPNKSPANNSTAPLSPRPVRVARVAPGSLDPWGLTNPHNGQRGGPGCRQGPRRPCGPLGVNPLSFPQFCPQHVNKTAHISVHMNVDRNKDRVHDVIWTNIEKSAIRR